MDLTDRKILKILEENSKSSLSDISRMVNLSIPSVRERINKMKDLNIIEKYTIDINYNSLGFGIDVIINISIKNNLYTDFKTFIKDQENVEFCYRISGESCFVLKCILKPWIQLKNLSINHNIMGILRHSLYFRDLYKRVAENILYTTHFMIIT